MIGLCSDHAGYELKEYIKTLLDARGLSYKDFGTYSSDSCDYPDYAHPMAEAIERGEVYLEVRGVGRDHDELVAGGFNEGLVLREEGGDGNDLAVLAGEGRERRHERRGSAAGKEEVRGADLLSKALGEVFGHGGADAVIARAAGVAVDLDAALGVEYLMDAAIEGLPRL